MVPRKLVTIVSVVTLATLLMLGLVPSHLAEAVGQTSLGADPIIGAWHVTVSFDDSRPNVLALYTFDRDRNFTMDGSWPGLFGSGHGSWNQNGDDSGSTVAVTFFRLLYSPSEQNEATGALNATFNGTLKVQAKLTVSSDGKNFTGRYLLTNLDPSGNVRSTTTGSFNATRIVVEPLP